MISENISDEILNVKALIKTKTDGLLQKLLTFDVENKNFIELELTICKEINTIGAQILQSIIPLLYGDGYKGPQIEIDEETAYSCEARKRERNLQTVFGKISITRAIYTEYHTGGIKSFLDEKLGIENKRHCPLTKYWSDLLGIVAPFGEASDILNKIRGLKVSIKQIENSTENMGKLVTEAHESLVEGITLNEKNEISHAEIKLNLNAKRTVYLETDGCHINTNNGWKECKTFMLFETEKNSNEEYRLKNKFYYSTMNDIGELKRHLKYCLEEYCKDQEVRVVCIGDGAKWIWKACEELFPKEYYPSGIIEIIDFYHALEKIGDIKKEVFTNEIYGKRFFEQCDEYLQKGNIEIIEQELTKLKAEQIIPEKKKIIDETLQYFANNKKRMRYEKYRKEGLCIGSGAIESSNKYVIQRRVKLQGMRWDEENLNFMVHLRAEYINEKMDSHYGIETSPLMNTIAVT